MNTSSPLVSIALATYNGARHLDEQLWSLRRQTYAPLEIVACDDGSTDATLVILERHAAADDRLRLVPGGGRNRGLNGNFMRCFAHCRGAFIAPCDQDDIWLPEKIARLMPLFDDPGTAIAYADSAFMDEQGVSFGDSFNTHFRLTDLNDPRLIAITNCVSGHGMVFRQTLLAQAQPFPARDYYDWWLTFVALSTGQRVRYLDAQLVHYRRHGQAQTHRPNPARNTPAFRAIKNEELAEQRSSQRAMAGFASPYQPFFVRLERAWVGWRDGLTGLTMAWLVWRHAPLFYGMLANRRPAWVYARKFLAGYRAKRLLNPRRYPAPDPDYDPETPSS